MQEGVCTFPKISADNSENFLTKTVPDGVHDGKDEVEAVADVERNQDVVEAVPHFSSGYIELVEPLPENHEQYHQSP